LVKECLCVFLGLSHIYVPIIEKKKGKGWWEMGMAKIVKL
jgi:hypothetical protein